MEKLFQQDSPYITSKFSTRRIMLDVIIALIPCIIAGVIFFGWGTLILVAVCSLTAFLSELLYTLFKNNTWNWKAIKGSSATDLSCILTGILLALNVPNSLIWSYENNNYYFGNIWMVIVGTVFAIVIVKMLFGGIGKNFANPALTARIFMVISFSALMGSAATNNIIGIDAVSSATWLSSGHNITDISNNWLGMLLGNKGAAALGETSIAAIILGFIYLTIRKVIDPRLPLLIITGVGIFAFLFEALPNGGSINEMLLLTAGHLMTGGLAFGAVFMATDYSTSPNTVAGKIIFGLGIALLIVVIRVFGSYPEGVSFAIVLMNLVVPIIDKFIYPKAFGKRKLNKAGAVK